MILVLPLFFGIRDVEVTAFLVKCLTCRTSTTLFFRSGASGIRGSFVRPCLQTVGICGHPCEVAEKLL